MIGRELKHYRILDSLGKGGMGDVYMAEDTRLERRVAIKFLPFSVDRASEQQLRFIREAKAAARVNHTNIAQVYGFDEIEGRLFIVMEYVDGRALTAILEEEPQRGLDEIVSWTRQVGEALAQAHYEGVIHRDIKPANILVTPNDLIKIVDFGLAKLSDQPEMTTSGSTLGTGFYMSPEQLEGREVDHRTDIWSLGVVVYEMAAGERPFRGDSFSAVAYSILSARPRPIDQFRDDLPLGLQRIIDRALSKDPAHRYQNVRDMIGDLESVRIGAEISRTRGLRASGPAPSIAVLPFMNLSAERDQEYLCDGMAEEVLTALSMVEGLRVVARTSAFAFKGRDMDVREIGRQLNVDSVLGGSIQRAGERLRISVQLTNTSDGYHVWSERFDRQSKDIFEIQDEISLAVVENLKIQLLGEEEQRLTRHRTSSLDAHHAYLKGLQYWGRRTMEDLNTAIKYFEQAIGVDPQYAAAHAGIADVYTSLGYWGFLPPKGAFPAAKTSARRALQIDDSLAEAQATLGWISTVYDWDWTVAENQFRWALELNPNSARTRNWFAVNLMFRGCFEEAIRQIDLALELDPLSLLIHANAGAIRYCARRYDEAEKIYKVTLELEPNFGVAHLFLGCLYLQEGRHPEAISELRRASNLTGGTPWAIGCLGIAYAHSGEPDKARVLLEQLEKATKGQYISPVGSALIHLGLGETEKFREWAEDALQYRDVTMPHLKVFPEFDTVRSEPWFTDVLRQMKLVDELVG